MNLALHGLLLQLIVSIVQFQHGFRLCSAGEPGYLDFDNLPETNFSCQGKVIGGYYADVEAGCQMFHVCTIGQKDEIMDIKFLCLNGTVFDQETRVCERVDEVDCSKSERFYNLNLELYGNNAVTLSLHETASTEDEDDPSELVENHESQRTTSSRPSTTGSTSTTTPRPPGISSTTSPSGSYQHPNGYPQHYQPQPRFPSVQTSQSKSLYDDKNGGYHHQYIYHTGDHRNNNVDIHNDRGGNNNNNNNNHHQNHNNNNNNNDNDDDGNDNHSNDDDDGNNSNNNNNNNNNDNNQATSYQLFSNQGVSSTTGAPQIQQIRYSSTPSTQIQIHNDQQPTVSPIFHATSSTIQTLLNSNANSPALINPIFHNHGIVSTTEQFTVHNNNPRETDDYRDEGEADERTEEELRRPLEAIQPTTQGKVSKLKISPPQEENDHSGQHGKNSQLQQRITTSFLPTPTSEAGQAIRSFYPTPRTSTKSSSSRVTHIHLPPPPAIPQLKPHQVTINLPPPDIQRIVQNPSPLLPSQSRVIVTAKASVSDESGRPLNSTQLVTLPLPTIPASYDDYKEGDESFDPFYRDVPKVRNDRRVGGRLRWSGVKSREKRTLTSTLQRTRRDVEEIKREDAKAEESPKVTDEKSTKEIASVDASDKIDNKEESQNLETESKVMESKTDLKTISSSLDPNPKDTVSEKSVIDTKESDAEEYVNSEDDVFGDSKIFEEPESQTSKEVEVRAITEQDSKYTRDRSNRLDKEEEKNSNSKNSNSLGTSEGRLKEKSPKLSIALSEVTVSNSSGEHSTKKLQSKPQISEKEEDSAEEEMAEEEMAEEEMAEEISQENLPDDDYYYDAEMDDSSMKSNEGDSVEGSKESSNKINPSSKHSSARHSDSLKTDANDTNEEEEEEDLADDSTMRSNEQTVSYEMSDEYDDSSQVNASTEDSREVQDDEGEPSMTDVNATQESIDDVTSSTEEIGLSEGTTTDKEEHSQNHEKHLSDGVLKFTDEIPISEKTDEPEEAKKLESLEETPHDYIDDNYEPQNYKEQEVSSSTIETMTTGKVADDASDEDTNESSTSGMSALEVVAEDKDKQNDQAQPEDKSEAVEKLHEKSIEKPILTEEASTTTAAILTSTINTATMSTTTTTTPATTTTITTPATTTTTTTPATTTTTTTTSATTTTTTTTPATTTTTKSTTARPTPPKLFKPFTARKTYVYVPPSTTPVPVIIKPRLPLLNPKPAKPPKSYNELAPKPIIRKSPLFARKALTTARTTTPHDYVETTENRKVEEITLSPTTTTTTTTTEAATTQATAMSMTNTKEYVPLSTIESVEASSTTESQTFTPYPMLKMTEANVATGKELPTTDRPYVDSNDVPSANDSGSSGRTLEATTVATLEDNSSSKPVLSTGTDVRHHELPLVEPTSDSSMLQNNVATTKPQMDIPRSTTSIDAPSREGTTIISDVVNRTPTLASIKAANRRPGAVKRTAFFNCLEKEMYRFYADDRDCRLFHYCSPGFTSRQVLDFRFVCEEGTAFDEETQSCIHDVKNPKCRKRVW